MSGMRELSLTAESRLPQASFRKPSMRACVKNAGVLLSVNAESVSEVISNSKWVSTLLMRV